MRRHRAHSNSRGGHTCNDCKGPRPVTSRLKMGQQGRFLTLNRPKPSFQLLEAKLRAGGSAKWGVGVRIRGPFGIPQKVGGAGHGTTARRDRKLSSPALHPEPKKRQSKLEKGQRGNRILDVGNEPDLGIPSKEAFLGMVTSRGHSNSVPAYGTSNLTVNPPFFSTIVPLQNLQLPWVSGGLSGKKDP